MAALIITDIYVNEQHSQLYTVKRGNLKVILQQHIMPQLQCQMATSLQCNKIFFNMVILHNQLYLQLIFLLTVLMNKFICIVSQNT